MLNGSVIKDLARMDRPIKIYSTVDSETDYGFRSVNQLVSSEWAEELPKTRMMTEGVMGGKEASTQEIHFRIRKATTVTTKHYLLYDGQVYDIITILPEGRDYQVLVTQLKPDAQWPLPLI